MRALDIRREKVATGACRANNTAGEQWNRDGSAERVPEMRLNPPQACLQRGASVIARAGRAEPLKPRDRLLLSTRPFEALQIPTTATLREALRNVGRCCRQPPLKG